jgi:hypothetical protein
MIKNLQGYFYCPVHTSKVRKMSSKQDMIKEMLAMQKKFTAYEQANGVDPQDYFTPEAGSEFDGYRAKYQELANKVIDMAHEEAGSER